MQNEKRSWDDVLGTSYKLETPDGHVAGLLPFFVENRVDRVLDLGCGLGRHFRHYGSHGFRIVGLDISEKAVRAARLTSPGKGCLTRADMSRLPFKDGSFDLIIIWRVVHLAKMTAIADTIKEIKRVLKKDGFLYASLRSVNNTLYSIGKNEGTEIEKNTFSMGPGSLSGLTYHFFSEAEALGLLGDGMEVLQFYETELEHTEYTSGYRDLKNMFYVFLGRNK
ncbi:MAG: class I SAM-dependent methyltransferase [Nitrospirota bacterium]